MSATLTPLDPISVQERLKAGKAVLIDIREPNEFASGHAPGAIAMPLSAFDPAVIQRTAGQDVIFTCKSGMRTDANCERLSGAVEGEAFVVRGGLNGWAAAGLPVETAAAKTRSADTVRQAHLVAGLLVLTGLLLGWQVNTLFFILPAIAGAGLTFAGVSGVCLMARLLAYAPWNKPAAA